VRVSAIIPTYNRAALLPRALESALSQTYEDLEIIVVDDGSTDDTPAVVDRFANRGRPLRYFKKPNGGCASARNFGLQQATGQLIAFLDSDDEWLPTAIAAMADVLKISDASFVFSPNIEYVDADRNFVSTPPAADKPQSFAYEHLLSGARACSMLYRRSVFDKVRFDEKLRHNEDWDFLQRVAIVFEAAYCPVTTSIVHHHGANKSSNDVANARSLLRSTEAIFDDFPEFCRSLGERADSRRRQLRQMLVRALLAAGDLRAAREEAGDERWGTELDLLLALGWGAPLRWQKRWNVLRDRLSVAITRLARLRRGLFPSR
jgi:glycosyltransferase involved in cell wall biosynthesis